MDNKLVAVYRLIDPRDDSVFYVGQSIDPWQRFGQHLGLTASGKLKTAHIKSIIADGLKPAIEVLQWYSPDSVDEAEKKTIHDHLAKGHRLRQVRGIDESPDEIYKSFGWTRYRSRHGCLEWKAPTANGKDGAQ